MSSLKLTANLRTCILAVLYTSVLVAGLWLSYLLRFDFGVPLEMMSKFYEEIAWLVPFQVLTLIPFGQFSGLLSYFSIPDLRRLFFSITFCSVVICTAWWVTKGTWAPPRGVILADYVFALFGLIGCRMGIRIVREKLRGGNGVRDSQSARVAILGAGDAGAHLAKDLLSRKGLGMKPIVFLDDEPTKWGSHIYDVPVQGAPELLSKENRLGVEKAIIAMPSASAKRIRELVRILQTARIPFQTIPSLDQLATGRVKVTQLRPVEIEDLLGRESVTVDRKNIGAILENRVVMVTGAGGSIGSELCRQIVSFNPKRLLLVEQSEIQLFQIEQELLQLGQAGIILPLVADILDDQRMRHVFERFRPQIVFHAAAHKHVPLMEIQPSEAIKNNTMGTVRTATLAQEFRAERFVLISTDKAINPTNVMGATKRVAEIFIQALQGSVGITTKYMAVRFGNVLGSNGSVIPIFQKQIAAGGPVKVTHPEMKRYFMTIPEAVGLVLQSGAQGIGGEIFILDMGNPVKIVDLARQMIELSGLKVGEDIEIEFTGLRPGEKLFEELSHGQENVISTDHPKILRLVSKPAPLEKVRKHLDALQTELHTTEVDHLKERLKQIVPEYQPYFEKD